METNFLIAYSECHSNSTVMSDPSWYLISCTKSTFGDIPTRKDQNSTYYYSCTYERQNGY